MAAEEFRLLVEGASGYAIFLLDPEGYVLSWNAGAERITGYAAPEIVGEHVSRFYPAADREGGLPARALAGAVRAGRFEGYGWRVRKDGSRFYAHVTVTALYDERGSLRGFAKVTRDMTAEREAERALREREQRLAEAHAQAELFRRLQRGLLPSLSLRDPALLVRTRYQPGHQRALLGADFFDALDLPDGTVAALIGDVAGHGPEGAAIGVALRSAWRALTLTGHKPEVVLDGMDRVLARERASEEVFATVCCLRVSSDRRRVALSLAGHPPPLLASDGEVVAVGVAPQPALGILDGGVAWEATTLELGDAWGVLCYTDGLIEGSREPGSRERFGMEALRATAARLLAARVDVDGLLDGLLGAVQAANGGELPDDVAILCLCRQGPRAAGP